MSRRHAPFFAAWVGFLLLAGGVVAQSPARSVTGKLELTVKLVKKDLSVIPAPKKAFKVASADPSAGFAESLTITFEASASIDLPAGKYAGDFRPVVTVQAFPEVTMSGGSKFGVFMLGGAAPQKYKFKTDFEKVEPLRDGKVVEPILPGRIPNVVSVQSGNRSFKDVAYYRLYGYPPEAIPIPPEVLQRIRADFGPYFEAMPKEGVDPGGGRH